jgi:hypothetical protein
VAPCVLAPGNSSTVGDAGCGKARWPAGQVYWAAAERAFLHAVRGPPRRNERLEIEALHTKRRRGAA